MVILRLLPALLGLGVPLIQARAQAADTGSLRRVVAGVAPGTSVRVETRSGLRYVAPVAGAMSDGFALRDTAGATRTFPYADISRFWVRKRAIGAGAATGAVVGAGFGVAFGLLAAGLCESSDCPSLGTGAFIGGLAGSSVGALGGAIVGAAIPRWSLRWSGGSRTAGPHHAANAMPPAGANPEVERHRVGEFTLFGVAGYGGFPANAFAPGSPPGPGPGVMGGVEGGLGFRAGRFAFGPEAGLLFGGEDNWSLAGMARLDLAAPAARLTPYLVGGLGGVFWRSDNFFESDLLTVTLGAGLTIGSRWRVEARWQPAVQNTGSPKPSLFTVAAGPRLVW